MAFWDALVAKNTTVTHNVRYIHVGFTVRASRFSSEKDLENVECGNTPVAKNHRTSITLFRKISLNYFSYFFG